MTPLAIQFAHDLAVPVGKRRVDDRAGVLGLIGQDMHCFEVTAVGKSVGEAMDADNLWNDAATMLPRVFLPSPVTWLEMAMDDGSRIAWVVERSGDAFRLSFARDVPELFSMPICEFYDAGVLSINRIGVRSLMGDEKPWEAKREGLADLRVGAEFTEAAAPFEERLKAKRAQVAVREAQLHVVETEIGKLNELQRFHNHGVVWTLLVLDLINTPGLVGLRQHDPHRGLARKLRAVRGGSYPLRGWSEIVLKHRTRIADEAERHTGTTYHKCLHFVRSHLRRYRDGKVTVIPAHWRGDPALGIKRTRYLVAA